MSLILKRIIKIFSLLFLTTPIFANVILPVPNNSYLPIPSYFSNNYEFFNWPARLSGWGLGGNYLVGMADGMVPIIGNDQMMLYSDFQGKYATRDWFAGAGIGLRGIYDNARILGAYVFADRNQFVNPSDLKSTDFWFISPGVESLGNVWDFRVNGYIPVSSQKQHVGSTFADNLGNFDFVVFRFHQQYNHLFEIFNVTGYGADGEIGHVIPGLPNARVYVGGYYFDPKSTNSIRGVEGRINIPINHYIALTAADSYDNDRHNSVEAGVKLTWGGIEDDVARNNNDIGRRMVDPLPRNLATLNQGTAQPIKRIVKDEGRLVLERDNIYFFTTTDGTPFNAANGTQNCTFENPCPAVDFTQTTIDSLNTIASNTNFYLDPGTYDFSASGGGLTFNNGQSVYGRTVGYKQPASGNDRPVLASGTVFTALTLLGNNTIDSIQLTSGGVADFALIGIEMNSATNVLISNSQVGNPAKPGDFVSALSMSSGSQATVINSTLSANLSFLGVNTVGVVNDSQLTIKNSSVLAQNTFDASPAIGIVASGTSRVNVTDSSISAINTDAAGTAVGIQTNDNAQVSVSGSTISATATTADALQQNGASTITVTNSRCFENGVEVACTP